MSSGQNWPKKFAVAISGIAWSARHQSSFWVHLPVTFAVVGLGVWLQIEAWRWAAVIAAITIVYCAELLNSSVEQLVRVLHPDHDRRIGIALDTAAGAVLIAAAGAVAMGLVTLALPLWNAISIWF